MQSENATEKRKFVSHTKITTTITDIYIYISFVLHCAFKMNFSNISSSNDSLEAGILLWKKNCFSLFIIMKRECCNWCYVDILLWICHQLYTYIRSFIFRFHFYSLFNDKIIHLNRLTLLIVWNVGVLAFLWTKYHVNNLYVIQATMNLFNILIIWSPLTEAAMHINYASVEFKANFKFNLVFMCGNRY